MIGNPQLRDWAVRLRRSGSVAPLLSLVCVAAGFRLYLLYHHTSTVPLPHSYPTALRDHFLAFVWTNSVAPPLNYVINWLTVALWGPDRVASHLGYLTVNLALGVVTTALMFRAMVVARVNGLVAWGLALATSAALIPLEFWRANTPIDHYDHHTPVLAALLAYACALVARDGFTTRSVRWGAVAGGLFVLQSSAAAYFVPVLLALIVVFQWIGGGRRQPGFYKLAAIFVLPALLGVGGLAVRNRINSGIFAPGTKGGAALMMFLQSTLKYDNAKLRAVIVESGAPDWYLWCFDHPQVPSGSGPEWAHLSRAFGTCMPFSGTPGVAGQPWPFDFSPLVQELSRRQHTDLVRRVEQDQVDAVSRQYVLVGLSPELSPRWISIYGQVSQRVFLHFVRTQQPIYLAELQRAYRENYFGQGPEFLARTADDLLTQGFEFRPLLFRYDRFLFPAILRASMRALPWALLVSFVLAVVLTLLPRRWVGERVPSRWRESWTLYVWLGVPIAACALLYSGAVAVENDRYFVQSIPYLVVVAGLISRDVSRVVSFFWLD